MQLAFSHICGDNFCGKISDCTLGGQTAHYRKSCLWRTVRKIAGTRVLVPGHQNSGAPTYFFQVFSSLHAHSCWPCSDKTRFCVEHINTLGKQEKFKTLKPILEIKTKNCWSAWKGTRLLVPGHQNFGAPNFIWSVFSPMHAHFMLAMF